MAKNAKKKSFRINISDAALEQELPVSTVKRNIEMVTIPKFEFDFLMQQNAQLIKQNRDLQKYCNGRNTRPDDIYDSLGFAVLNKYCGEKR